VAIVIIAEIRWAGSTGRIF